MQSWEPSSGVWADYESVSSMNNAGLFKTRDELATKPYPENIFTVCLYWELDEYYNYPEKYDKTTDWADWSDNDVIDAFSIPGDTFVRGSLSEFDETWWPCELYRRSENHLVVRIYQSLHEEVTQWQRRDIPRFVTNLPKDSIRFVNRMETSDQHLPNAFRHPIGLPDGMFPEQWMNLVEK